MKRTEMMRSTAPLARTAMVRKTPMGQAKPKSGEPRAKKCQNRACRAPYMPDARDLRKVWCSDDCAVVLAQERVAKQKAAKAKAERAADRKKRSDMATIPQLKAKAQTVFNEWVRLRDLAAGHGCICCGKFATAAALAQPGGAYDACHYRSRGSADHLRFDERNVHLGLKDCNTWGHQDYRGGLIARIGLEAVEALERDQTGRKWTREYLEGIITEYRGRVAALKKNLP